MKKSLNRKALFTPSNGKCLDSNIQILRLKKLKSGNNIKIAAAHNLREIKEGRGGYNNIDSQRSKQNVIMYGPDNSSDVANAAKALMKKAGIRARLLRKDSVLGVEVVISLPSVLKRDSLACFRDSLNWVRSYFSVPVISAVVHNDQPHSHCHIIIVPIVDGRMNGSRLVGYKRQLHAMQVDFHQKVGKHYGLTYQTSSNNSLSHIETNHIGFDIQTQTKQKSIQIGIIEEIEGKSDKSLSCVGLPLPRNKLTDEARKRLQLKISSNSASEILANWLNKK